MQLQETEAYLASQGFQKALNTAGLAGPVYNLHTATRNGRIVHAHIWTQTNGTVKVNLEQIDSEIEPIEGLVAQKTIARLIVGVADLQMLQMLQMLQTLVTRLLRG
jgi:hypothetical protein